MARGKSAGKAGAKADQQWQKDMNMLQSAMRKLQNSANSKLKLPAPISRAIAGAETHAEKVKLLKEAIRDANWAKSHSVDHADAKPGAVQEQRELATSKFAALEDEAHTDAIAAEELAKSSPQMPATSVHQMQVGPQTHPDTSDGWEYVPAARPKVAPKVAQRSTARGGRRGRVVRTAGLSRAEVARKAADSQREADIVKSEEHQTPFNGEDIGWQNQFHQGFQVSLDGSWADHVQESVDGGQLPDRSQREVEEPFKSKNVESSLPLKMSASTSGVAVPLHPEKPKKPNKKAKLRALAALAALAGESETIIEAETQNEHIENVAGGTPGRPPFCGDQLGLPIASLYATFNQQTRLEIVADREEQQKLALEQALARQECIKKLSCIFPDEAMTVKITLIGHATHLKASLLGLPESIQERIYRLVLVGEGPFRITPSNHQQPALLRTCQQLRMETLWIFENENTFSIEVADSQPVLPANYTKHWARQVAFKLETTGTPKWDGLKKWLKAYHEDGVPGLRNQGDGQSMPWDVCAQAFELVLSLRAIFPEMTFEEMEPMLKIWKNTVALQQVVWSWD